MKKLMSLVLLLAAVSAYAEPGQCGRFQIVSTSQTMGEASVVNEYMIDTATGRIWNRTYYVTEIGSETKHTFWSEQPVQMDGNRKWAAALNELKQALDAKRSQKDDK